MESWLQYQSVLQLAVATNIGVAGLLSVYGSEFGSEERKLTSLYEYAESFRKNLITGNSTDDVFRLQLDDILARIRGAKGKFASAEAYARPFITISSGICFLFSIVSLFLLLISSLRPEADWTTDWGLAAATLLVLPPFIAIFLAWFRYLNFAYRVRGARSEIENMLFNKAGAWLQSKAPQGGH